MRATEFKPELRSSLAEALDSGGYWPDWEGGSVPPVTPQFIGENVTDRMQFPYAAASHYPSVGPVVICDAVVRGRGFLCTPNGALLWSDGLFPLYLNAWIKDGVDPTPTVEVDKLERISVPGVSALVHHAHCDIFGHWLVEGLPKLLYLHSLGVKIDRFVLQQSARPHISNWLRHVAPDVPIVTYDEQAECVVCERLLTATMATSPRYVFNPRTNDLVAQFSAGHGDMPKRLIYVDRTFPGSYHWLENDAEVRELAQSLGFEIFYPAKHSIPEQLRVFSEASVIAGDYGSALHNSLFSPSNTRVLAFNWVTQIQSRIAQLRGQEFGFQLGTTGGPVVNVGYRLDLDLAKRAFEKVLSLD